MPESAASVLKNLSLTALNGYPLSHDALAGKAVLVVNVASRCGLTPQYTGLEALYEAHKDAGLVVLGVPCNQFAGQEPGTAEEIQTFCSTTYGVSFPLLEKQDCNGPGRSPLYKALIDAAGGGDIQWNFEKFLIGRDGAVRQRFSPRVTPEDPALGTAVAAALAT